MSCWSRPCWPRAWSWCRAGAVRLCRCAADTRPTWRLGSRVAALPGGAGRQCPQAPGPPPPLTLRRGRQSVGREHPSRASASLGSFWGRVVGAWVLYGGELAQPPPNSVAAYRRRSCGVPPARRVLYGGPEVPFQRKTPDSFGGKSRTAHLHCCGVPPARRALYGPLRSRSPPAPRTCSPPPNSN